MSGEVKRRVLTWRFTLTLVAIAIAVSVLTPVITYFTPRWAYFAVAISGNLPLAIMFIALVIGNLFPEKVSSKHVALIAATSIMAILIPGARPFVPDVFDAIYGARTAPFKEFYGFAFGPIESKYINHILMGHVANVPWSIWLPTLLWWIMYSVAWLLLLLSFLAIVRRRWIDIEVLPYPAGYAWSIPIVAASPERRAKGLPPDKRLAIYLGGLLLGFLYTWLLVMRLLVPWLPDVLGWTNTAVYIDWYPGAIKIEHLPSLQKIVGLCLVPTNIIEYMTFLLAPLDILLSAWIVSVALLIVIQILWLRGYYSGIERMGFGRESLLAYRSPLKLLAMHYGIFIGITLLWLILNARYLGSTLKSAITGPTREEIEQEAIPYRIAWLTVFICLIYLFILCYATGVTLFGALMIILQYFLLGLSVARIYGLSPIGSIDYEYLLILPQLAHYHAIEPTPEFENTIALGQRTCTGELAFNAAYAAMFFRIAKDVGISPRDMFTALLIGALAGAIIQWFVSLKLLYAEGYSTVPRGIVEPHIPVWTPAGVQTTPYRPWWPQLLVGLALAGVLSYLRVRFVWWPIDPVGAALGFGYLFGVPTGMFLFYIQPFVPFVTWLIKYLVIKLGGVRVHDNILIPLAAGVLSGTAVCWFVGGIAIVAIRILPIIS